VPPLSTSSCDLMSSKHFESSLASITTSMMVDSSHSTPWAHHRQPATWYDGTSFCGTAPVFSLRLHTCRCYLIFHALHKL
jgi:hypothetical protein